MSTKPGIAHTPLVFTEWWESLSAGLKNPAVKAPCERGWNAHERATLDLISAATRLTQRHDLREFEEMESERDALRTVLLEAEALRPRLLKDFGYVPEYVLDFCNKVRAALAKVRP